MTGALYLVPNLLGAVAPADVLPQRTIDIARRLDHWIVETPKPARAFLKSLDAATPIANLTLRTFPTAPTSASMVELLAPAREGRDIGVLTDAGCPGIADPGAAVVAAAHEAGVRVVPLVGPSAVLLALMASGMNGQRFAFHGYLPVKADARGSALATPNRSVANLNLSYAAVARAVASGALTCCVRACAQLRVALHVLSRWLRSARPLASK